MKTLATLSILGVIFGWTQPLFAQVVHVDPMPWSAQLGVCGGCLTILFFTIVRVIPKMAEENRKCMEGVSEKMCDGLEGVRTEIRAGNDSSLAIMRNYLHKLDSKDSKASEGDGES
jgi:hypothetical protein